MPFSRGVRLAFTASLLAGFAGCDAGAPETPDAPARPELAAAAVVQACGGATPCRCGDFLRTSRQLNQLDQLTNCRGTALTIVSDNVVLDCAQTKITCDASVDSAGVWVPPGLRRDTIANCAISDCTEGILAGSSAGPAVESLTVTNNVFSGTGQWQGRRLYDIKIMTALDPVVTWNRSPWGSSTGSVGYAIELAKTTRARVSDNVIHANSIGLTMSGCNGSAVVERNTFSVDYHDFIGVGIQIGDSIPKCQLYPRVQANTFRLRPLPNSVFGLMLVNTAGALAVDGTSNDWKTLDGFDLPDGDVPGYLWDHVDEAEEATVKYLPTR